MWKTLWTVLRHGAVFGGSRTPTRGWRDYRALVGNDSDRATGVGPAVTRLVDGYEVEVRRSSRRRRTVSAYREAGRIVVLLPARSTRADEARWVAELVGKIVARERRESERGPAQSDATLLERAEYLNRRYLAGRATPASVRWVGSMRSRWASCTPVDRSIRVSERLRRMPAWVLDYVVLHELAHLLEAGHGPDFWTLVAAYPRTERARGYLDGVSAAAGFGFSGTDDGADPEVPDRPLARPDAG